MGFVTDIIGEITGSNQAADAAAQASEVQAGLAREGMAETNKRFDEMLRRLNPYEETPRLAIEPQANLLGLRGNEAQQGEIQSIVNSPYYQAMKQQGENAILQNSAAIGATRSGNAYSNLLQFAPQLLQQMVQQRLANLSGFAAGGQNAAALQGQSGMQTGANIANLMAQQGQAQAGGILAQGNAGRQAFGDVMSLGGTLLGSGMLSGFKMPSFGGGNVGFGVP